MKTTQWDADIEKSLEKLRIVDKEITQHLYNLYSLSGGRIGKKPPNAHRTVSELLKERGV